MPQNAAGCRTEPPVSEPIEARHRSACTATAEPPDEPPGTRSVSSSLRAGPKYDVSLEAAHGKLVAVLAANEDGILIEQALHGRAGKQRLEAVENLAAALQRVALVGQHVFQADNHAGQLPGRAGRQLGIHGLGLGAGLVGPHFQEGVEVVLLALDVVQVILNELAAGGGAGRQLAANFRKGIETSQDETD